jgi:uncharacterized protein (TIGR03435 family)
MRLTPLLMLASLCLAQTPPAFEAASIKVNKTADPASWWKVRPGGLVVYNMSIKNIAKAAYGIQDVQFSGAAWLDEDRYDIDAKANSRASGKELVEMLQTLLADRFKLTLHRETRQVPGYALVVAKSGLKIKPSDNENTTENESASKFTANHIDMPRLARLCERVLKQPVIDDTHLAGGYDFILEYSKDGDPNLPTIFTAVTEKLGLKLEPRKLPVEVVVVDHAERPSDN